mgnify:CR=1 FL=1
MELLCRTDYSTESRPKLFILDSLFFDEYSITKPYESKMVMIVERKRVEIITNYKMLLGLHEIVLQKLPSPVTQKTMNTL